MNDALSFMPSRREVRARYRVCLLVEAKATRRGVVHREEGAERVLEWGEVRRAIAAEVARTVVEGLPPERLGASIKSLATDGLAADWHPDLASFEEAVLGALF